MGTLADKHGGKIPGELIRSTDWNTLMQDIDNMQEALSGDITELSTSTDTRLDDAERRLQALETRLGTAETSVTALNTTLESLKSQFRRVSLHAEKLEHPFGIPAVITAHVADILGNPLNLSAPAGRPWIDFVATWGYLKPAPGFESSGGTGDRTTSVRVNASGEAKVLLQAEALGGLTEEEEEDVQSALTISTRGNGSKPVFERIMRSSTAADDDVKDAFETLTIEYDRDDKNGVRVCVDKYYVDKPGFLDDGRFGRNPGGQWRDCRSTVIALAKPDSNPVTPDASLGACSIQVKFRDWISPWIVGYTTDTSDLEIEYGNLFISYIDRDFGSSASRIRQGVLDIIQGKGVLGRRRNFLAVRKAMRKIVLPDPPPFLGELKQVLDDAVSVQQSMEYTQSAATGVEDPGAAFKAFAESAVRSDVQVTKAREELSGLVQQQMGKVQETVQHQVRQQQQDFERELLKSEGLVGAIKTEVNAMRGEIQGVQRTLGEKADIKLVTRVLPDR